MFSLKKQVRIVLVNPSHPGNIGAVARAMKNMGLAQLYLVAPKRFPHMGAVARATGAKDLLNAAIVVNSLDEALVGCTLVIATSSRLRKLPHPLLTPREASEKIVQEGPERRIAILFGNEKYGLNNEDLRQSHYQVCIPTDKACYSLNLAMAVQVMVYELYMTVLAHQQLFEEQAVASVENLSAKGILATVDELEGLFKHIESTMIQIGFLHPSRPRTMMPRIRRMFNRSRIDKDDLNLLRGMMTAIDIYRREKR
jgi:TrmH family RNA methyltransferase